MRAYMRRRRAKQRAKPRAKPPGSGRDGGQLARTHRAERGRPVEFTEVGRLRAQIASLKSAIANLKAALQQEPDAAKLRKKVADQQVQMTGLRQLLAQVTKQRDKLHARVQPKYREAERLLTRQNYRAIIRAVHPDRATQCTTAELATAATLVTGLQPLFVDEPRG